MLNVDQVFTVQTASLTPTKSPKSLKLKTAVVQFKTLDKNTGPKNKIHLAKVKVKAFKIKLIQNEYLI